MKSIEIGERRGQIPGKKYCPLRLGFRRLSLEAQEKAIEDLQRQLADLTARFREHATRSPQPSLIESFNARTWRPPKQLPLLAAEDMATYRITAPRRPALHQ